MKMFGCIFAFIFFFSLDALNAEAAQKYVVKEGDTCFSIARKFNVKADTLLKANRLSSPRLKTGISLTIPGGESRPVSQAGSLRYHTVKKGETLSSVARRYSLSLKEIKELNNIKKTARLKPGRQLLVRKAAPDTYKVRKGDTLKKLAKKFDTSVENLMEINELESSDLKPGQTLLLKTPDEDVASKESPIMSEAKISEEIKTISESEELSSLSVKDRLILFARKMLDIPYRFGGSTFMGIDCSGYVQKVFGLLKVALPRTAREQYDMGEPVEKENLSIGDLVFFKTYASFPSHVGIYLGNNLFIHASSRSKKVSIDSLETPYYFKRFIGAKRLFRDEVIESSDPGKSAE